MHRHNIPKHLRISVWLGQAEPGQNQLVCMAEGAVWGTQVVIETLTPEPTPTRVPSPTVSTPAALPDLRIRAVEVSQAGQRPYGDVPLVADRPVVVRVNV